MTQKEALNILKLGHNVYLTGQAGSGKTYVLNQYIDYLRKNEVEVAVTASTGIAATHMNGITIHSWSGLGIRNSISDYDLEAMEEKKYLWDRIKDTKVLIIDEVSMLHHFRLDMVEKIVRAFKRNSETFGGMQVVLCGDFFQLPPVSREGEEKAEFIYRSEAWRDLNLKVCYLHEQFRQKDETSLTVLNAIRSGVINSEVRGHLKDRHNKDLKMTVEPTRLYTHNYDVDNINFGELEKIPGEARLYQMTSRGIPMLVEALKKSCLAPERLLLKKGARVMFVKNNYETGYVNGTLGVIKELSEQGPIVETSKGRITAAPVSWTVQEDGKIKAEISQVPLRLAWAITVHKSQGMSLDAVEVDLSKSFEKGMGYVALSRVRSFEGLKLLGLNEMALQVHDEILEFDDELRAMSEDAVGYLNTLGDNEMRTLQEEFTARVAGRKPPKKKKGATTDATLELALAGHSLKDIAKKRELGEGTILDHLEKLVDSGKADPELSFEHLKPKRFGKIEEIFLELYGEGKRKKLGDMKLSAVREILGSTYDFIELRLARLFLREE
ncbi:MAG: AAA family ATPase [Patescibacteria group bacterium]